MEGAEDLNQLIRELNEDAPGSGLARNPSDTAAESTEAVRLDRWLTELVGRSGSDLLLVAGAALLAAAATTDEFPAFRTQAYSTQQATAAAVSPPSAPVVTALAAPRGSDGLVVRWVSVSAPDLGTMLAAVATPAGRPPFPTVLLLHHGTHGFARE